MFLLNSLEPEAAVELETLSFTDDELFRRVEEEQQSLIDDFVAGDLTEQEERAFELRLQQTPTLRHQVKEHHLLLEALERRASGARVSSVAAGWGTFKRGWIYVAGGAALVALVLIVGLVYQARSIRPASGNPTLASNHPKPVVSDGLTEKPDAVFFLASHVTRGFAPLPVLPIPPSAANIELQIELPSTAATVPEWTLADLDGHPLGSFEKAATQRVGAEVFVSFILESSRLSVGRHSIHLQPLAPGGASVRREFRVVHQQNGKP
jgi:hypothetical protein